MAENDESTVTAFTVETDGGTFDINLFLDTQAQRLNIPRNRFNSKSVKAKSPVMAILKESAKHDLMVLGTTNRPMILQMATQSIPEKIACRCKKPLIMVKKGRGVRSWIKRWI